MRPVYLIDLARSRSSVALFFAYVLERQTKSSHVKILKLLETKIRRTFFLLVQVFKKMLRLRSRMNEKKIPITYSQSH